MSHERISVVITKRWARIYGIDLNYVPQKILDFIDSFYNDGDNGEFIKELFVNIAVIGDDRSDKIGLIYNYIHDDLIENDENKLISLKKRNETEILSFTKTVKLSSKNCVNISISCLSQLEKYKLSEICTLSTKSIIFTFNLCYQSSLSSVKKWYKDCNKMMDHSFVPILVGTNYETFKDKEANYRISIIEQSRKYAKKMKAILLFISTFNKQQINIKEIFLIILSKIYYFDHNISSISNSKLPIIEFYDNFKSLPTPKKERKYKSMKVAKTKNISSSNNNDNNKNNMDHHNRTKTSIEDIQNRLSIIRGNLYNKNNRNSLKITTTSTSTTKSSKHHSYDVIHNQNDSKIEELYDKFELNYKKFMKKQIVTDTSISPEAMSPISASSVSSSNSMYPSFLHHAQSQSSSPIQAQAKRFKNTIKNTSINDDNDNNDNNNQSLSDLLQNDALGLNTLHQENINDYKLEDNNIKRKKHERAMSMMPSLLNRSKTYDDSNNNINNNNKSSSRYQHNKAMPSMPNFLHKLQKDNQLKNIISTVFTQTNQHNINNINNHHIRNRTVTAIPPKMTSVPIPKFTVSGNSYNRNHHHHHHHHHNEHKIEELHHKIHDLESVLVSYQNIIKENSKTVSILKKTISKIESQRDCATKKIELLNKQNVKTDNKELIALKNKNIELKSLSDALAMNLMRKQQSLEEALHAIHTLNETKHFKQQKQKQYEQEQEQQQHRIKENESSKSLTDADILSLSHSKDINLGLLHDEEEINLYETRRSSDSNDDDNNNNNNNNNQSFTKGIARRLRSLSNSLTHLKNLDPKSTK